MVEGMRIGPQTNIQASKNITLARNEMFASNLRSVDNILFDGNDIAGDNTGTGINFSTGPNRNVTIRRNHIRHHSDAIQLKYFDRVLIGDNEFSQIRRPVGSRNHPDVVQTFAGGTGLTIRGNFVHDFDAQGFFIANGVVKNVVVENNVLVRAEGAGLPVRIADAEGLRFVNNTVLGTVRLSGGTRNAIVLNNVLEKLNLDYTYGLTIREQDFNLIGSAPRFGHHDIKAMASYVNPSADNFELTPRTPGVDSGTTRFAPPLDQLGRERIDDPQSANRGVGLVDYLDMGALEMGAPGRGGLPSGRAR